MLSVRHLTLARKAAAAWFTVRSRVMEHPLEGGSIRLLYRVFQPVFFRPMRRNALNQAWTSTQWRPGTAFPAQDRPAGIFMRGQARKSTTGIRIVLCSACASGKTRKVFFIRVRDVDDA